MAAPNPNYWLVKTEPNAYSWDDLVEDGWTYWDGIRNYESRNNLRKMAVGDRLLYYHSGRSREVVGVAEVIKEHYQDPTTDDDRWSVVDIKPVQALERPVTLAAIKNEADLSQMFLVRRGRLSVTPVTEAEYGMVLALGGMAEGGAAA